METIARSGSHYFQWKPFFSVEAICFIRSYSFQWKMLFLVETIPISGSHYFQWKPLASSSIHFHLVETVPFNGRHFLHWKLFLLLEAIHFSENHSFQWKPFPVVEAIPFRESLCFSWKSLPHFFQWKLLLLIETFPFSGSHSFQCFNIFVRRTYRQLRELLNINDSVRLLKMANLSCIHIPVEVFQSSEAYLGHCRTSGMKRLQSFFSIQYRRYQNFSVMIKFFL